MNKKPLFFSILLTMLFSLVFGYTLVFAEKGTVNNYISTDKSINLVYKTTNNIYNDAEKLSTNRIMFKSGLNLSSYTLYSKCIKEALNPQKTGNFYTFDIKFKKGCKSNSLQLRNSKNDTVWKTQINMISKFDILSNMLDFNSSKLVRLKNILDKKSKNYRNYITFNKNIDSNYYSYLRKNRILEETRYNKSIIEEILEKRKNKYIVPVLGHSLPTRKDKIPNSGRPYRQDYTDGIHHSWDIDTKLGEKTVSLDDAIVIRVVRDWNGSFFDKLKYGELTKDQKTLNLDILRGNQVWLKTMKGEVVFYGHLNRVAKDIKINSVVKKGQFIGTVGITGVPDKNYKDYHLDFSIRKNPYTMKKAGNYSLFDYMNWDWVFKGEGIQYIIQNQNNVFES